MLEWSVPALVHVLGYFSLVGLGVGVALTGLMAALDL